MIGFALIIVGGVFLLLYPTASNWLNQYTQSNVISDYQQSLEQITDEDKLRQIEDARQYNQELIGNVVLKDPFDAEALKVMNENYPKLLAVNYSGVMGYIDIPKIDVDLPIYHGTSTEVLTMGVGHLENTSLPVGGLGTHAVLSGHTGLPSAKIFTDLNKLEINDVFYIKVMDETLEYKINQIKIVEPSNTQDLLIDTNHDYVTLVTCTPYGVNSHRLLVRGERVENSQADNDQLQVDNSSRNNIDNNKILGLPTMIFFFVIVVVAAVLATVTIIVIKRKKMKQHNVTKETGDSQ
ncbi:MAG TPA: class C sortase [Clostridiales bacterium]|nr:class C sortase [Clostridiales bacterium]